MGYQPFYIADYEQNSGLENYFESFLIPEKAFTKLQDAYCWRGRIKRRKGYDLLGRLGRDVSQMALPATVGGDYINNDILLTGAINFRNPASGVKETYAEILAGSVSITLDRGGLTETTVVDTPFPGTFTVVPSPTAQPLFSSSINYVTGAVDLSFIVNFPPATTVDVTFYYYPSLPVMGLRTEELPSIDIEKLVAFDQKYVYQYNVAANKFEDLYLSTSRWTGAIDQLFWTTNYWTNDNGNIFWATNFNVGAIAGGVYVPNDPIRWYDITGWTDFTPAIDGAGSTLVQALLILPFKGRLLVFNTYELTTAPSLTNYYNRVRWSWIGDPTDQVDGWLTTPGKGGFLDAATDEHIVSVEYCKDVILVKFERSSWRLVYTGNEIQPFIFQKINTNFGSTSPFSLVPFDDGVYSVSNVGITTDDTTGVERIDLKIPKIANQFLIQVDAASPFNYKPQTVYGIRDFPNELVYWTYLDSTYYSYPISSTFSNQMLVFNYRNNTYATFNDSFICFGKLQYINNEPTPFLPEVVAGNQQGFVEILSRKVLNDPSLAIFSILSGATATFQVVNHNFSPAANYWVRIDGILGNGPNNPEDLNYSTTPNVYLATGTTADLLILFEYNPLTNAFDIPVSLGAGGEYLGGGTLTVLQNFDIQTKYFSPHFDEGQQCRLGYVDFYLDKTDAGQTACSVYINEFLNPINDPNGLNAGLLGNNILLTSPENPTLIPLQVQQSKIWHRFFVQALCQNFLLKLQMNNAEMASQSINNNDFVLHAITLYLSKNARMTQ